MNSQKRHINLVLLASAWATIALVVLWVASSIWYIGYMKSGTGVGITRRTITVASDFRMSAPANDGWYFGVRSESDSWSVWFERETFRGHRQTVIALWPFIIAGMCLTFAALRHDDRERRRALSGKCVNCGYDRAGIGRDAKCPECGMDPRDIARVT